MTVGTPKIRPGMNVVGQEGTEIGSVREVHDFDFILDRPDRRPIYVPFLAVDTVDNGQVKLTVTADEVDLRNWATFQPESEEHAQGAE